MLKSANHCFGSTVTIISLVYTLRKKRIFLNVQLIFIATVAFKIINGSSLSPQVFSCYFPAAVKSCTLRPYRSTNSYFNNGPAPYFIFDYRLGKNLITQEQQHHLCNSGTVYLSVWSRDEFTTTERVQSVKLRILCGIWLLYLRIHYCGNIKIPKEISISIELYPIFGLSR